MDDTAQTIRVLLIEDNMDDVDIIRHSLLKVAGSPFHFTHAERLQKALQLIERDTFDIILLDLSLPDSDGYDTFLIAHEAAPHLPVVVLTGMDDDEVAVRAVRDGAQDYLCKQQATSSVLARVIRYAIERHRLLREVREMSLIDELTGLHNRRGFLLLGQQQFKLASRTKRSLYLLFADLDRLKSINDNFGHQEGDAALLAAGQLLQQCFRDVDVTARIGGDEFAVLWIQGSEGGPESALARIRERLAVYNASAPHPYEVSMSLGVTSCNPDANMSLEDILAKADAAMYLEKQAKKAMASSLLAR